MAICTRNRADLLDRTLEQMTRMLVPDRTIWELLVVNNGSTDNTDQVITEYAGRLPIRALSELEVGLSTARNAAVREAAGEYLLWTDDDVLVDKGWLAAYLVAFEQHPEAVIFGGPILPSFENPPPRWLHRSLHLPSVAGALALRNVRTTSVHLTTDRLPFGANFAVRAAEQKTQSL